MTLSLSAGAQIAHDHALRQPIGMPAGLVRAVPAARAGSGPRAIAQDSLRGKILALLALPGVADAVRAEPVAVADLAASLPLPAGKKYAQWVKEIGSVLATDLKTEGALFARGVRRCSRGRFTLLGSEHLSPEGAPLEVGSDEEPVDGE